MSGDATATRRRLIEAAVKEFARHGIAGARVDRIAKAAKSNKAQIYHYFGSKEALFDAAFKVACVEAASANPIDVTDLPAYAGRIFDIYVDHPEIARLLGWYRLERRGRAKPIEPVVTSLREKVGAIRRAQAEGVLPSPFGAVELLALILHLCELWAASTPEFDVLVSRTSRAQRRRVVTDAVAAIVAAPGAHR